MHSLFVRISRTNQIITLNSAKMKVFIVVAVLGFAAAIFAQTLTPEQQAKVKQYYHDCVASSGVDEALVKKGRQGEFTDDAKLKQFIFCFFKKAGFQNEAGELQVDVIKQKVPLNADPNEADKVIAKCKDVKGSDPADTAFEVYKCYWNATPHHVSLA